MPDSDDAAKSKTTPQAAGPLWMMSLFLGISETISGIVSINSTAWIQAAFAIFAIGFPCVVITLFFIVLWKRPYILYTPRDYPENVDVEVFVKTMRENVRRGVEVAQTAAESSAEVVASEFQLNTGDRKMLVQLAKDAAERSVRRSVAQVDLTAFAGKRSTLEFLVSDSSTVDELLDAIYASIAGHVAPYTYGVSWLIKIKETDKRLAHIGTNWAMNNNFGNSDTRTLHEIGLSGGSAIEVIDLRRLST